MKHAIQCFAICLLVSAFINGAETNAQEVFQTPKISATETEKLADGLYAFRWGAYRSIFMVTDEGVIATDPMNTKAAALYRAAIAEVTDQPVKYLVYSHSHWDHASGGQIFKDEGAQIVAQERCVQNMEMSPKTDVVRPDITFKDTYKVELGGTSLDLFYFGPSHGTCLVVMIPRPHKMMFSIDIVTPPTGWYMPWDPLIADLHFYNVVQYLDGMQALAEREGIEKLIGAHLVPGFDENGDMFGQPSTGPVAAIAERRKFWNLVVESVKKAADEGTPTPEVHNVIDLTPFETLRGYDERNMKLILRRAGSYYSIGR